MAEEKQKENPQQIKYEKKGNSSSNTRHLSFLDDWYLSRIMAAAGYIMLGITAILVIFIAIKYYSSADNGITIAKGQSTISFILQHYATDVFILIGALISGNLGLRLIFGANPRQIIPDKDRELLEPLIKEANKDAINQYVILSSLSGFTGMFQKIGFSGLPLATVILTLIFSFLSFFTLAFMELAKLTLGAFIGSFVQKGQNEIKLAQQANDKLY